MRTKKEVNKNVRKHYAFLRWPLFHTHIFVNTKSRPQKALKDLIDNTKKRREWTSDVHGIKISSSLIIYSQHPVLFIISFNTKPIMIVST